MANFSMCDGKGCPRRLDCDRYTSFIGGYQSWIASPMIDSDSCNMFIGNRDYDQKKRITWKREFKLYRWLVGGKWARNEGIWHHVGENDYINELGLGFHFTYRGIEKREDYTI